MRTWANMDRSFERALKKQKGSSPICPVCNKKAMNRMTGPECLRPAKSKQTQE